MAEQLRAEAGGLERAAEPDDQREHARFARRALASQEGLDPEGCEAHQSRRGRSARHGDQRTMSLELEEVLAAGRETSAPAADELTADTELSRDLTLGPAPDVDRDRDRGLEDELERMNLSRDRVAGEDALATTAVDAAGEDHPERPVRAFPRGEPALDPGLREPDSGAAAARTRTLTTGGPYRAGVGGWSTRRGAVTRSTV